MHVLGTPARRASRISRSVDGRPEPVGSVSASSSSSTKNGLPSDRRWIARDQLRVGRDALDRLEQRARLVLRQPRDSGDPLEAVGPLQLGEPRAAPGDGGGARPSAASSRPGRGSVRRVRTRKPRVSRVAGSDQWTSSTITRTGRDLGQPPQHADQGVEQPRLEPRLLDRRPGRARARARGRAGRGPRRTRRPRSRSRIGIEVADELAEDLDDRAVRQALLTDVRAAPRGGRASRAPRRRQRARRRAGSCRRRPRRRPGGGSASRRWRHRARRAPRIELGPASDRDGADEAAGHAGDHTEGGHPRRIGQRTTIAGSVIRAAAVAVEVEPDGDCGGLGPARPPRACPGCSTRGRRRCSR